MLDGYRTRKIGGWVTTQPWTMSRHTGEHTQDSDGNQMT